MIRTDSPVYQLVYTGVHGRHATSQSSTTQAGTQSAAEVTFQPRRETDGGANVGHLPSPGQLPHPLCTRP